MKKLIFVFFIIEMHFNVLSQCNSSANYPFDGNANDISGNNLHGVNFNATLTTDRLGNSNQAYDFNGTSSYIELNNSLPIITNPYGFSIEAWARMDGVGGGQDVQNTLFVQRTDATGNGNAGFAFHLENSAGNIAFGGRGDAGGVAQSVQYPSMPYSEYHHYVALLDNNILRIYVDGQEVANAPYVFDGNVDTDIDYVFIGKNRYLGFDAGMFNGVIDYVKIYNCALSASEILDMATLAINEFQNENSVLVYPNPVNSILTIDVKDLENVKRIRVYNITGQIILDQNYTSNLIDVSTFSNGMYQLIIDYNDERQSQVKFIKE